MYRFLLLCYFLLLTGCAALAREVPAPSHKPEESSHAVKNETATHAVRLEKNQNDKLLYYLLVAELSRQQGNDPVAAEYYLLAAQISTDPQIAKQATLLGLKALDYPRTQQAAKRWEQLSPGQIDVQKALVRLAARNNKPEEGIASLEFLLKESASRDKDSEGFYGIFELLSLEIEYPGTLALAARLTEKHAQTPHSFLCYARLALMANQSDLALEQINKAIALSPHLTEAWLTKAQIYLSAEDAESGFKKLKEMVEQNPGNQELRLTYAKGLLTAKRLSEAKQQLLELFQQGSKDPTVTYTLALLALHDQTYTEAKKYLNLLLETEEYRSEAWFYLGRVAETESDWENAINYYKKIQEGKNYVESLLRIPLILAQQGKEDQAYQALSELRKNHKDLAPRTYVLEGEMLRNKNKDDQALTLYTKALLDFPDDHELLYARAMMAEKLGKIDLLEKDLTAILEQDPEDVQALNALGYTFADRAIHLEEASRYIEKAFTLMPDDPAIVDSMGWIRYRLGKPQEALGYLRRAFDMSPDPEIGAHLGEVLWVLGDHAAADVVWQKAQNSDSPLVKVVTDTIKRLKQPEQAIEKTPIKAPGSP